MVRHSCTGLPSLVRTTVGAAKSKDTTNRMKRTRSRRAVQRLCIRMTSRPRAPSRLRLLVDFPLSLSFPFSFASKHRSSGRLLRDGMLRRRGIEVRPRAGPALARARLCPAVWTTRRFEGTLATPAPTPTSQPEVRRGLPGLYSYTDILPASAAFGMAFLQRCVARSHLWDALTSSLGKGAYPLRLGRWDFRQYISSLEREVNLEL